MVKRCCIESSDLKSSSVVLFMAFFAQFCADRSVIALFLLYPRINLDVATQTFIIGKRFTYGVACCAVLNALPASVAADQLSGRNLGK
jgi:hypothetical protein